MRMRTTVSGLLMGVAIMGCAPTDPPLYSGKAISQNDTDRIYKAKLLTLTDGQTTRTDVTTLMGQPDRVSDDGRVIMYYWTTKDKDAELMKRSFLISEFGPTDVLVRHLEQYYESQYGGLRRPDDALRDFIAHHDVPGGHL